MPVAATLASSWRALQLRLISWPDDALLSLLMTMMICKLCCWVPDKESNINNKACSNHTSCFVRFAITTLGTCI